MSIWCLESMIQEMKEVLKRRNGWSFVRISLKSARKASEKDLVVVVVVVLIEIYY